MPKPSQQRKISLTALSRLNRVHPPHLPQSALTLPISLQRSLDARRITIRIERTKPRQQRPLNIRLRRLRRILGLSAPSLLHRINEVGGFRVAEVCERGNVEGGHHVVVFVDEVVAVEHVDAVPRRVAGEDTHFFVGAEEDDVFEGDFL